MIGSLVKKKSHLVGEYTRLIYEKFGLLIRFDAAKEVWEVLWGGGSITKEIEDDLVIANKEKINHESN